MLVKKFTKADFSQNIRNTTTWTNSSVDYTVSNLTYDGGGNILSMTQRGLLIGSSTTIDSLAYTYTANSNQLQKVGDGITDASPLGDFKDSALTTDYTYDVNGNITKDYNRHMHTTANGNGAVYNLLDKPDSMVIANKATLYYTYDAAGVKLLKKVNDYSTSPMTVKNYLYIDGFVYLNDTLQYVNEEEGRIRWAKKRNNSNGTTYYAFEYDYYLRDHLGNVRSVLTEGKDTATYAATMETADSATVEALFSNVYDPVRTVTTKPAAFDTDPNNHFVSKLTGNTGGRIGPSIILKVMAGDKVQINTYAYYTGTTQTPVSDNTLLTDLLSTLVSGITNQSAGKIGSGNSTALSNAVSPNVLSFLGSRSYNSSLPKAYLNWVLLDDQFKYVAGNMGALQVQSGSSKQPLVAPLQTMAKNGYLYVYLSNQSPQDVYFDDLIVTQTTGPLVQEQSYYPFGLQMAGISDKAMIKLDSKNKFNGGGELEEDYGVNLYYTETRTYDPQLGRFGGVDALAEQTAELSTYHYSANNPLLFNDPTGALFDHVNAEGQFLRGTDEMQADFESEFSQSPGGSGRVDLTRSQINDFLDGLKQDLMGSDENSNNSSGNSKQPNLSNFCTFQAGISKTGESQGSDQTCYETSIAYLLTQLGFPTKTSDVVSVVSQVLGESVSDIDNIGTISTLGQQLFILSVPFHTEELTYQGETNNGDFTDLTCMLDEGNAIFTGYQAATNADGTSIFHAVVVTGYYNDNGNVYYSYFNPDGGNTQVVSQKDYNNWNKVYQVGVSGVNYFFPFP